MQKTQFWSLLWEDPMGLGTAKIVWSPRAREPVHRSERSHHSGEPARRAEGQPLLTAGGEEPVQEARPGTAQSA